MISSDTTREAWLCELVDSLRPLFWKAGATLPDKLRVSCGWPSSKGLARKVTTIGECWYPSTTKDGYHNLFITPLLDDPIEVSETLVHELVHTVAGAEAKHSGAFKRLAEKVGLTGKMTATIAGEELRSGLILITSDLPPYPHGAITPPEKIGKQGTRMRKVFCPECDYTVRTTAKWLEIGLPTCPCGTEMIADNPEEEGEGE